MTITIELNNGCCEDCPDNCSCHLNLKNYELEDLKNKCETLDLYNGWNNKSCCTKESLVFESNKLSIWVIEEPLSKFYNRSNNS